MSIEQLASAITNPFQSPEEGKLSPEISQEEWEKNRKKEEKQDGSYALLSQNEKSQKPEEKMARKEGEEGEKKYPLGKVKARGKKIFVSAEKALVQAGVSLKNAMLLLAQEEKAWKKEMGESIPSGRESGAKKAQLSGEADILFARYNQRESNRNTGEIQNA